MDLLRKPDPTHRVPLIAQAGQAVTEHQMSRQTVPEGQLGKSQRVKRWQQERAGQAGGSITKTEIHT